MLKIVFSCSKNIVLPVSYYKQLQGFVYNMFSKDMGTFLHDKGFSFENKIYKMIVYSKLLSSRKVRIYEENKVLNFGKSVFIILGTPILNIFKDLIYEFILTRKSLFLGSKKLEFVYIKNLDVTQITELETLSPITISDFVNGKTIYYNPFEEIFWEKLANNLSKKYEAIKTEIKDYFKFKREELINFVEILKNSIEAVKKRIVKYGDFIVEAYDMKFKLKEKMRKDVVDFTFNAGLGDRNSAGFGLVFNFKEAIKN